MPRAISKERSPRVRGDDDETARVLSARWAPASGVAWYADEQDEVELFAALVLASVIY